MTQNTNKTKEFSEKNSKCGSAGIGRQARLRGVCCMTYGFKSHLPHQQKLSREPKAFCFAYEESKCMGLEEAVVNQATVWPESGADRAAASRENPVLFSTPNQYNPNWIFQIGNGFGFFLIFLSQRYNPLDLASMVSV